MFLLAQDCKQVPNPKKSSVSRKRVNVEYESGICARLRNFQIICYHESYLKVTWTCSYIQGMFPGAAGIRSGRDTCEIIARQINKKKEKYPATHSYQTSSIYKNLRSPLLISQEKIWIKF